MKTLVIIFALLFVHVANANTDLTFRYNSDGYPDIVSIDNAGVVAVRVNNQGNSFSQPKVVYNSGLANGFWMRGDLNGDGFGDLVGLDDYRENYTVLLNNGYGGFSAVRGKLNNPCDNCKYLLLDINNDTKADLVSVQREDAKFVVYNSNGYGMFNAAYVSLDSNYTLALHKTGYDVCVGCDGGSYYTTYDYIKWAWDVYPADIDADGIVDDIVAIRPTPLDQDGTFLGYIGTNGFLSDFKVLTDRAPGCEGCTYLVNNLDNKNGWDILAFRPSTGTIMTWFSTGNFTTRNMGFSSGKTVYSDRKNYSGLNTVLADINGDGLVDLLATDVSRGIIRVFFNKGNKFQLKSM